jgi:hypothetical protein
MPVDIDGQQQYASSRNRFSSRRVALIQRYQFGRNRWFHPSLGAGIDVVRESSSRHDEPIVAYDQFTRQSRVVRQAIEHPDEHHTGARALIVGGFKAYLTPRTFFLSDMRVTFASRAEDVLVRVGFGVDF